MSNKILSVLSRETLEKMIDELSEAVSTLQAQLTSEREYVGKQEQIIDSLKTEMRYLKDDIRFLSKENERLMIKPVAAKPIYGAELNKEYPMLFIKSQEDYIKARENEKFCMLKDVIEFEQHLLRKFEYVENVQWSGKIGAIKCWRNLTGSGLKEAKEVIENWKFD